MTETYNKQYTGVRSKTESITNEILPIIEEAIKKYLINDFRDKLKNKLNQEHNNLYQFRNDVPIKEYIEELIEKTWNKDIIHIINQTTKKIISLLETKLSNKVDEIISKEFKNLDKIIKNKKNEIQKLSEEEKKLNRILNDLENRRFKWEEKLNNIMYTYTELRKKINTEMKQVNTIPTLINIKDYLSDCKPNEIIPIHSADYLLLSNYNGQYILVGGLIQVLDELKKNKDKKQSCICINTNLTERYKRLTNEFLKKSIEEKEKNQFVSVTCRFWYDLMGNIYYIFIPFDFVARNKYICFTARNEYEYTHLDYSKMIEELIDLGYFTIQVLSIPEVQSIILSEVDYSLLEKIKIKEKILKLLKRMHEQESRNGAEFYEKQLKYLLERLNNLFDNYAKSSSLDMIRHTYIQYLKLKLRELIDSVDSKHAIEKKIIYAVVYILIIEYLNYLYKEVREG